MNLRGKEIIIGRSFALMGGLMNVLSGRLFETIPRAVGGALSITGNLSGWISEKFFLHRDGCKADKQENAVENIKNWMAGHQLLIANSQKALGSSFLIVSGIINDSPAEIASGSVYTIANSLEVFGEKGKKYWLVSTALSGVAAGAMVTAGVISRDPMQTAAGTSYLAAAVSLALANPKKYGSFRERLAAEKESGVTRDGF